MEQGLKSLGYDLARGENLADERPPQTPENLPRAALVNLKYLPPVGMQSREHDQRMLGAPPTCTAWATTYGLATFMAALHADVQPNDPSLQASPAHIYCQVRDKENSKGCGDTFLLDYFDLLRGQVGTPSLQTASYSPDCATLWKNYNPDAACDPKFALAGFRYFKATRLDAIKTVLAFRRPLAYSTALPLKFFDFCYDGPLPIPVIEGPIRERYHWQGQLIGHCMLIIGYDDDAGENGAFVIQNSFGTGWGSTVNNGRDQTQGYVWIGYDLFNYLVEKPPGGSINWAFYIPWS